MKVVAMAEQDYVDLWFRSLFKYGRKPLQVPIIVTGSFYKQLGAMSPRALVSLRIENADKLEIAQAVEIDAKAQNLFECAIFGFLDVAMTTVYFPKRNVRITLERIEVDAVESTPSSFHEAGLDAGRKAVEIWKLHPQARLKSE